MYLFVYLFKKVIKNIRLILRMISINIQCHSCFYSLLHRNLADQN